jgi:hypothetical protein
MIASGMRQLVLGAVSKAHQVITNDVNCGGSTLEPFG